MQASSCIAPTRDNKEGFDAASRRDANAQACRGVSQSQKRLKTCVLRLSRKLGNLHLRSSFVGTFGSWFVWKRTNVLYFGASPSGGASPKRGHFEAMRSVRNPRNGSYAANAKAFCKARGRTFEESCARVSEGSNRYFHVCCRSRKVVADASKRAHSVNPIRS